MTKKIPHTIVANWKMNGLLSESMQYFKVLRKHLLENLVACEVVICPPATLLRDFAEKIPGTRVKLGGQNCAVEKNGAYTGEISAEMLKNMACEYVILGHSERRHIFKEASEQVQKKAAIAHEVGLKTIICIGETAEERKNGKARDICESQLLHSVPATASDMNTLIAYEPVWAIGTDVVPTSAEIIEMQQFIIETAAKKLPQFKQALRVLYGGSANEKNAKEILALSGVNGLLVGRASLDADRFWKIINAASQ